MNNKLITRILLIICCLSLPQCIFQIKSVKASSPSILLVYDSIAHGTNKSQNIDSMKRLISAYEIELIVVSLNNYKKGMLINYTNIIILQNLEDSFDDFSVLEDDLNHFNGKVLFIGSQPFKELVDKLNIQVQYVSNDYVTLSIETFSQSQISVSNYSLITTFNQDVTTYGRIYSQTKMRDAPYGTLYKNTAYLPFYQSGTICEVAVLYLMNDWLNRGNDGQLYLFINDIYPFSDLDKLQDISDLLYNAGIPFIIGVNPIFTNFDYPSSLRYLEVLKYVQSKNGSIIVISPTYLSSIGSDNTIIKNRVSSYIEWLAENQIVPLGTSAEIYTFYDEYYLNEQLAFYDSAIIINNKKTSNKLLTDKGPLLKSSLYSIDYDNWQHYVNKDSSIEIVPINIAITLNYEDDLYVIEQKITMLINQWVVFSDYKNTKHLVKTDNLELSSQNGILSINGKNIDKNNSYIEINAENELIEEKKPLLNVFFNIQNKVFVVLVIVVLILFLFILMHGNRIYKNKYIDRGM